MRVMNAFAGLPGAAGERVSSGQELPSSLLGDGRSFSVLAGAGLTAVVATGTIASTGIPDCSNSRQLAGASLWELAQRPTAGLSLW